MGTKEAPNRTHGSAGSNAVQRDILEEVEKAIEQALTERLGVVTFDI